MILFGSRGMTSTTTAGVFHCPRCGPDRRYEVREVRRWFTLYFIPIFPMNKAGEYVECKQCAGTFGLEAIRHDPAEAEQRTAREIRRVLVLLVAKSGATEDSITKLRDSLSRVAGLQIELEALRNEVIVTARNTAPLSVLLKGAGKAFSEDGNAMLMVEGFRVVAAGSRLSKLVERQYREFADALGVSGAAQNQVIEHLTQKDS